jgi:hypothetical protein
MQTIDKQLFALINRGAGLDTTLEFKIRRPSHLLRALFLCQKALGNPKQINITSAHAF